MPEPELVVAIGEQDTLAGLSPWHIRLSEIMLATLVFITNLKIPKCLIYNFGFNIF